MALKEFLLLVQQELEDAELSPAQIEEFKPALSQCNWLHSLCRFWWSYAPMPVRRRQAMIL
jgi:hypothetical protein